MKLLLALALFGLVTGRPQQLQESIDSVLKSLAAESEDVSRSRPRIITKYDFIQTRDKKSHLDVPPEFVVSTDLHVSHDDRNAQTESLRSGRSHGMFGTSRRARTGFSDLASAVMNAPVVQGIRLPDDDSDMVVHRGGRFINNQYVPHQSQVPREMVVRAELDRTGRSYQSGEELYQTNDYTFSPLKHYEQQQQQLQQGLPTVLEADKDDFVIQEQTYQMCPGCPTFSVPVPIPKATDFYQDRPAEKSLFSRLADMVNPAIQTARDFFNRRPEVGEVDSISSRVDSFSQSGLRPQSKLTTPLLTSLAAVGFGLTSFFSSRLSGATGRQFEDDAEHLLNSIDQEFDSLSKSGLSVDDVLCLPRQMCDRLKTKKHLLAQYPNMKTVAAWMTEKYFQNVADSSSEYYSHGQCNIKQCLQELLN